MVKFFLIFSVVILFNNANAENIYGKAKIIDGDNVHIKSYKVRLEGIDAPEIKQKCKKVFLKIAVIIGLNFSKDYACGMTSKKN